jgi:hypothetical protein
MVDFLTEYMIYKLAPVRGRKVGDNRWELYAGDLADFIFRVLWREKGIVLNDSREQLEGELRYLSRVGKIKLDGWVVIVEGDLAEKARRIEEDSSRYKIRLLDEYIRGIDEAVKSEIGNRQNTR